jgi:RNA polymerase primary sigma factor
MNNLASISSRHAKGSDGNATIGSVAERDMDAHLPNSLPRTFPPSDGGPAPVVNPVAQAVIDELTDFIGCLAEPIEAPKLLKQLFCQHLDWKYVNQPIPASALPETARENVVEATIIATHEQIPLCYLRIRESDLSAFEQRKPVDRLARAWPTVLVAFSNFGQTQIDFCSKTLDGRVARISLDQSLYGAGELAQALYAMRAFDIRTQEPAPQIEVAERLERQLKRVPRRFRQRRGLESDPFQREIARHKLLSHDEEKRLRRQYMPGKRHSARDKLVLANLRLVMSVAYRYRRRGLAWDDLLQEGVCGLMRAADKYDPERGFKFSTYATWWIMQSVTRAVAQQRPLVATPVPWATEVGRLKWFWRTFIQAHGFIPSDRDIRDHFEFTDEQQRLFGMVRRAWACMLGVPEEFPCHRSDAPDELVSNKERNQTIERILNGKLDKRTAGIVRRRFGLGVKGEETLEQIGQSLSLTRERVRQLEASALAIFRHPIQTKQLEAYVTP